MCFHAIKLNLKNAIINLKSAKLESNLVSVITKISNLFLIISFNWSNLFGSELIFKWLITNVFVFFICILVKCFPGPQESVTK